ncbi:MAG: hypothetical protein EZS28_005005, partial [Streblomastix strix]
MSRYDLFDVKNLLLSSRGGQTCLMREKTTNRLCVWKRIIAQKKQYREQYLAEVAAFKNIRSKYTVNISEFFCEMKEIFVVTENIESGNLRQYMDTFVTLNGQQKNTRGWEVLTYISLALDHMHNSNQIIHRNIKPENIMLMKDGRFKLDFSFVSDIEPKKLSSKVQNKYKTYQAPEVFEGSSYLPASDVFGLGVVLIEMLTGQHPFEGDNQDDMQAKLLEFYKATPEQIQQKFKLLFQSATYVTDSLRDLIIRMLNKNPSTRPTPRIILDYDASRVCLQQGQIIEQISNELEAEKKLKKDFEEREKEREREREREKEQIKREREEEEERRRKEKEEEDRVRKLQKEEDEERRKKEKKELEQRERDSEQEREREKERRKEMERLIEKQVERQRQREIEMERDIENIREQEREKESQRDRERRIEKEKEEIKEREREEKLQQEIQRLKRQIEDEEKKKADTKVREAVKDIKHKYEEDSKKKIERGSATQRNQLEIEFERKMAQERERIIADQQEKSQQKLKECEDLYKKQIELLENKNQKDKEVILADWQLKMDLKENDYKVQIQKMQDQFKVDINKQKKELENEKKQKIMFEVNMNEKMSEQNKANQIKFQNELSTKLQEKEQEVRNQLEQQMLDKENQLKQKEEEIKLKEEQIQQKIAEEVEKMRKEEQAKFDTHLKVQEEELMRQLNENRKLERERYSEREKAKKEKFSAQKQKLEQKLKDEEDRMRNILAEQITKERDEKKLRVEEAKKQMQEEIDLYKEEVSKEREEEKQEYDEKIEKLKEDNKLELEKQKQVYNKLQSDMDQQKVYYEKQVWSYVDQISQLNQKLEQQKQEQKNELEKKDQLLQEEQFRYKDLLTQLQVIQGPETDKMRQNYAILQSQCQEQRQQIEQLEKCKFDNEQLISEQTNEVSRLNDRVSTLSVLIQQYQAKELESVATQSQLKQQIQSLQQQLQTIQQQNTKQASPLSSVFTQNSSPSNSTSPTHGSLKRRNTEVINAPIPQFGLGLTSTPPIPPSIRYGSTFSSSIQASTNLSLSSPRQQIVHNQQLSSPLNPQIQIQGTQSSSSQIPSSSGSTSSQLQQSPTLMKAQFSATQPIASALSMTQQATPINTVKIQQTLSNSSSQPTLMSNSQIFQPTAVKQRQISDESVDKLDLISKLSLSPKAQGGKLIRENEDVQVKVINKADNISTNNNNRRKSLNITPSSQGSHTTSSTDKQQQLKQTLTNQPKIKATSPMNPVSSSGSNQITQSQSLSLSPMLLSNQGYDLANANSPTAMLQQQQQQQMQINTDHLLPVKLLAPDAKRGRVENQSFRVVNENSKNIIFIDSIFTSGIVKVEVIFEGNSQYTKCIGVSDANVNIKDGLHPQDEECINNAVIYLKSGEIQHQEDSKEGNQAWKEQQ